MNTTQLLSIMEIIDNGKNRHKFSDIREAVNIIQLSKDQEGMRKMLYHKVIESLVTDKNIRKAYLKAIPQKRAKK